MDALDGLDGFIDNTECPQPYTLETEYNPFLDPADYSDDSNSDLFEGLAEETGVPTQEVTVNIESLNLNVEANESENVVTNDPPPALLPQTSSLSTITIEKEEEEEKEKEKEKEKEEEIGAEQDEEEHPTALWKSISQNHNPTCNWYLCSIESDKMTLFKKGNGGLNEMVETLKDCGDQVLLGMLRVTSSDVGKSARAKFIYIRFVGSQVGVMQRAKLSTRLGKYGEAFPVKHLTKDLDEHVNDFDPASLTKEFLRVGGAHKPDAYCFGPNQTHRVQ